MSVKSHLGVYAVEVKENKLLCIIKNKGPYMNRFDLPGGSFQENESLLDALNREVLEETGRELISLETFGTFDFFVSSTGTPYSVVHHIAIMYRTKSKATEHKIYSVVIDGVNDSRDLQWVDFAEITKENASPLVYKVKDILCKESTTYEAVTYHNWSQL